MSGNQSAPRGASLFRHTPPAHRREGVPARPNDQGTAHLRGDSLNVFLESILLTIDALDGVVDLHTVRLRATSKTEIRTCRMSVCAASSSLMSSRSEAHGGPRDPSRSPLISSATPRSRQCITTNRSRRTVEHFIVRDTDFPLRVFNTTRNGAILRARTQRKPKARWEVIIIARRLG